jgi:hypothetical protein
MKYIFIYKTIDSPSLLQQRIDIQGTLFIAGLSCKMSTMAPFSRALARPLQASGRTVTSGATRTITTAVASKKEGDISSVFASLSGKAPAPLPTRFANVKRKLIQGREGEIKESWERLLKALEKQVKQIEAMGSAIIPSVKYDELHGKFSEFQKDLKERGAGVIRGVIPQDEARAYKDDLEDYIKANPSTKGKPSHRQLCE